MKIWFLIVILFCCPVLAKHTLILGLDGISYQTMTKMHDGGYFRTFQQPIPMVATFPSISDPNWAHIMNAKIEKGFTKARFTLDKNADGSLGKEHGTLINHLTTPPEYEKLFDFKAQGVLEHLMTVTWTETSALFWIESLFKFLLDSKNIKDKKYTSALIVNTDILAHVDGEKKIIEYLKSLHKKIPKIQKNFKNKHKESLEIIIVSDHGNYFKNPVAIDYKKPLEKKGFFQKSSIRKKTDYAFVAPEIISFGAFYTMPGQEETFAKVFSNVDGVHVVLTDLGKNKIGVFSKNSRAEILIDPANKTVSYQVLRGKDPFGHQKFFQKKPQLSFDEYFYKTLKTDYPNALVRAWEGFYKNSQDKASVLVSPKLGYVFTNLTLKILTSLSGVKSSHGSFHREESLGVLMTTFPLKKEAIRPSEFQELIKK